MANITFSHPDYRDKTVYAVAGSHTETVLKLARENQIPIDFSCEDGQCGTCLIKVTSLSSGKSMASPLTDKEKAFLKQTGKLSAEELEKIELTDLASPWRLVVHAENIAILSRSTRFIGKARHRRGSLPASRWRKASASCSRPSPTSL